VKNAKKNLGKLTKSVLVALGSETSKIGNLKIDKSKRINA